MPGNTSPDITAGPVGGGFSTVASSEPRRPGRPRKNISNPVTATSSPSRDSPILEISTSTVKSSGSPADVPMKRGRGRPKRNVEVANSQQSVSPQTQMSPATSSPTQLQKEGPKRRGRKPKGFVKEGQDCAEGATSLTPPEDASMDTSSSADTALDTLPHQMDKSLNLGGIKTSLWGSEGVPMETEPTTASSSLFSSVLKSETPFGSGGGIPGLDLDECDANIGTGLFGSSGISSEEKNNEIIPPPSSFPFRSCLSNAESDNKVGILQFPTVPPPFIPKQEDNSKSTEDNSGDGVKKEDGNEENESGKVRRSSRIKTLEEQRGSRGRRREVVSSLADTSGLSRSSSFYQEDDSNSGSSINIQYGTTSSGYSSPTRSEGSSGILSSNSVPNLSALSLNSANSANSGGGSNGNKPLKVKSRWRYSLDAESMKSINISGDGVGSGAESWAGGLSGIGGPVISSIPQEKLVKRRGHLVFNGTDNELLDKLKKFEGIDESIFRTERKISKENKGMLCDCYLSKEDILAGETGCGEDCLNRLLMVECGNKCPTADKCSNKRFQKKEYASLEVFKTEKKGHGLRTLKHIPEGGFVIEYVGEVLDVTEFERRTSEYAKGNHEHFYFMALKSDAIIDATLRGNCSRFINHSCEPNCETQKWTVNGEVRIGFFAISNLQPGDEITFDYQFQRYGKKAQKCYCMTESCRGWIGEEEDDTEAPEEKEEEQTVTEEVETGEVETSRKAKPKAKVERKKRKNVQLEDMGFREELLKLEISGLKNRTHTLTLSRLMVRAEGWNDRERLLKILIKGDTPCRRLFLDYHGLRLIWSWMVDLPLPVETDGPQLIRNDAYHMLFLQALKSLPIPNKNLLMDSKVLTLVEKWCSVPSTTTTVTLVKRTDSSAASTASTASTTTTTTSGSTNDSLSTLEGIKNENELAEGVEISTEEPTSTAEVEGMQEVVEEKIWSFVPFSKTILESWVDLKEVFRIPKKERVEQMKEHEREADKGQLNSHSSSFSSVAQNHSYDRDHRNKQYNRNRGERRVPVLDSSQPQYHHRHAHPSTRMALPPGMTKEDFRKQFEASVKQHEEQEVLRRQQDALVTLHQERCVLVGLDPATTPIVDPHGIHYLDPKTVEWRQINVDDPTLPPELLKFVQLSQYPQPVPEVPIVEPPVVEEASVEPEQAFPPWPPGLPPPPPLPPRELPQNWKMAVDDEGRCYYYHIRTRVSRWDPPSIEDLSSSESSEESTEEEVAVGESTGSPVVSKSTIQTWRTKLLERTARRIKSGLVEQRIISPRGDDEKGGFTKEMVKENKKKVYQEKLARMAMSGDCSVGEYDFNLEAEDGSTEAANTSSGEMPPSNDGSGTSLELKKSSERKSSSHLKKKRKEKPSSSKGSSSSSSLMKKGKSKRHPPPSSHSDKTVEMESSSPIETELDLTLSQQNLDEEIESQGGFFSKVSAGPSSRIAASTASMEVVSIPGLGFDSRDLDAKKKAERLARHAAKKKALAMHKKIKEKSHSHGQAAVGSDVGAGSSSSGGSSSTGDKRVSSKEASNIKDAFRNSIASVVVTHLNAYRKSEQIKNTDDFKHLARKITHAILLKELKHTRDVTSLEVTESVKHKTKEYIKKFMARFPDGVYERSPDNPPPK